MGNNAFLIGADAVADDAVDSTRAERFGAGDATPVTQPWASHGPVMMVGPIAYFQGNKNDPNDKCGTDPLSMNLLSMRPNGTCPSDSVLSYLLVPTE